MYEEHSIFETPADINIKIWRYLDFTKFVSLIDKQALFFPWASFLHDPFEGKHSILDYEDTFKYAKGEKRKHSFPIFSMGFLVLDKFRNFIGINSWHMNDTESVAMWKLYLKSDEGVAIQSTFRRLRDSFHRTKDIIGIGMVKYIDYNKEYIETENIYDPYMHKRKYFKYEKELRAIIHKPKFTNNGTIDLNFNQSSKGIHVPIDLDLLIENIILSPTSEKWYIDLVKSIVIKYNLKKKVKKSSLDDRPPY